MLATPPNLPSATRAEALEEALETVFRAPSGLCYAFLDARSRRPFTREEAAAFPVRFAGGPAPAQWLAFENTPMAMGATLSALVFREKVAPTPRGRERISTLFAGICRLTAASERLWEAGWLSKPYDGSASMESSNDQYGEVMAGLWALAHLRNHPDAAAASELLVKLADFWVRHDYRCPYHGNRSHRWMGRNQWGLVCLAFVQLAWCLSGERRFREEAERLCREERCDQPASRSGNIVPFPGAPGAQVRRLSAYHHLVVRMLGLLIEAWPERAPHWQSLMEQFWSDDVCPGLAADGLLYASYQVGPEAREWCPLPESAPPAWPYGEWTGLLRSGAVSCFAAASHTLAGHYLPEHEAVCRARAAQILGAADLSSMTFLTPPSGTPVPDGFAFKTRMLDGRAPAQWLLAYWAGHANGWW